MEDTPDDYERRYRAMLMALTPQQRLEMASDLFATSRILLRAELLRRDPNLSEAELRVQMLLRFYGDDLTPRARDRAIAAIRAAYP